MSNIKPLSIYVHIPFCISKCHYCSFNSYVGLDHLWHDYFDALNQEIIERAVFSGKYQVQTIYFGGGTPTCVEYKYIVETINTIKQHYELSKNPEITIEANPKTVNSGFETLKSAGINRVSLGLQSTNWKELKFLGRAHNFEDFVDSYNLLREVNINNINVDLIYALPNQTINDWISSLERILELNPEHISLYSLSIEPNTKLYHQFKDQPVCSEELDRQMYHKAVDSLIQNGYQHYEISNHSKHPSYESQHNKAYWKCREYLGFGAGAHSCFSNYRYSNIDWVSDYIKSSDKILERRLLTLKEQIEEYMFLGFRLLKDGISSIEFQNRFGEKVKNIYGNILKRHISNGLITSREINGDVNYTLSKQGIDISNYLLSDFLLDNLNVL